MKHWQEKRNYQHVRDEAGNVRSNIITVDGIDVEVSDEVYLAYTQLDRRERYLMEEVETDKKLSLDRLLKSGVPLEKLGMEKSPSAEDIVLQNEAWQQQEQLPDALESTTGRFCIGGIRSWRSCDKSFEKTLKIRLRFSGDVVLIV